MRGATRLPDQVLLRRPISTHTPRAGRDGETTTRKYNLTTFLLTRPVRGATASNVRFISRRFEFLLTRPVRGATESPEDVSCLYLPFLLTRPVRGATLVLCIVILLPIFLLTRPVRGATKTARGKHRAVQFLLTRPVRGATNGLC